MFSIKEDIVNGVLQSGDRLPSIREMAKQLTRNPNTVSKAYKILKMQEVILTIQGKGTYIKNTQNTLLSEQKKEHLKQKFADLLIEASYLSIPKEEIVAWIYQNYR